MSGQKTDRLKPVLLLGRSRGPLLRSGPRTVNEVPRHQSIGRCCPRDVVAEIEDGVAEVFEDELEDGIETHLEIEPLDAGERRSRSAPRWSMIRFISTTAPRFSAARFKSRRATIASGPAEEKK